MAPLHELDVPVRLVQKLRAGHGQTQGALEKIQSLNIRRSCGARFVRARASVGALLDLDACNLDNLGPFGYFCF